MAQNGKWTRRRYLKFGGGTAVGISTVIGGCVGPFLSIASESQDINYGTVSMPEREIDTELFTKWVPPADAFGIEDTENLLLPLKYIEPQRLTDGPLGPSFGVESERAFLNYFGVDFGEFDYMIVITEGDFVLSGTFDSRQIKSAALKGGYEDAGKYRGYTIMERDDVFHRNIAFTDEYIIFGRNSEHHQHRSPRTIIDAGEGGKRFPESGQVPEIYDHLGRRPYVEMTNYGALDTPLDIPTFPKETRTPPRERPDTIDSGQRDSYVQGMSGCDFDGQVVYYKNVREYENGKTPKRATITDRLANYTLAKRANTVAVTTGERFVTVTMAIPYDDFPTNERAIPLITWSVEENSGDDTITIRHRVGQPVTVQKLVTSPITIEPLEKYADGNSSMIKQGDTITVPVGEFVTVPEEFRSIQTDNRDRVDEYQDINWDAGDGTKQGLKYFSLHVRNETQAQREQYGEGVHGPKYFQYQL